MSRPPAWLTRGTLVPAGQRPSCFLVEVVRGTLRVRGCRENSAIVVPENFEPIRNVRGVIFPRLLVQFQVGAQESGTEFCNEFFRSVAGIAPAVCGRNLD